jgi:hypothetical protein
MTMTITRSQKATCLSALTNETTTNPTSFPSGLVLAVEHLRHRYIRPRCPEENGKVERSHRIDQDEFWSRHSFDSFAIAAAQLAGLGADP